MAFSFWAFLLPKPCVFGSHLQIGMVSSILAYKFGSTFAWITSVSVATYIAFTLAVTQVQTQCYAIRSLKIFLLSQLFNLSL